MKLKCPSSTLRLIAASVVMAAVAVPVAAQKPEPVPLRRQAERPVEPTVTPPPNPPATQPVAPPTAPPTANDNPNVPSAAVPKAKPAQTPNEMVLNFQGADLQAVVKAISQMTGRNFLVDPRLKGQITIISAKPVSSGAAYQIFVSALKAQGFAAIEGPGNLVKIVPTGEARHHAPVSANEPNGGEQIVTHVVVLAHASAAQMVPLLRPLMAPTSQLVAYDPSNALILTDYADNVRRMLRIIEKIDQPVSNDVNVIPLQHASAIDIAEMVARLSLPGISSGVAQPGVPQVPGAGGGDRFSIVPDMRTNSLLVRADNPGRVNQLRSLIGKLDVPATTEGSTRVIYIRNANAVKLAEVLRGLVAGDARASQTSATPAFARQQPGRATPGSAPSGEQASQIQADEATNALIISASDAAYNNLRAVIEKLDVRRAQVYVEALIVEMTQDHALQLGIQWAGATSNGVGGLQNFPSSNPGIVNAIANPKTAFLNSGGLTLGYLGKSITLPDGTSVRSLGVLARALDEGNLANILSTPNLITLDNAEAKIVVGQNVPFITGSFAQATGGGTGGSVNPFQTIERKDIGLTLKIKPQISEGGSIKLDLFQEVSSISPTSVSGASDLITNKRAIETKVAIDDGDTIVLGGLIEDSQNQTQQSVPLLGRIPLLGALFRYRSNTTRKTNLMIFLRPVVVRTPDDGYRLTADRYEYLRAQTKTKPQEEALDRIAPRRPVPQKEGLLGPPSAPEEFAK